MAVPGWNVSEPLHIAKKIYDYVQAFRDAPEEVKSFSLHIKSFAVALEDLEDYLKQNPVFAAADDSKKLRETLAGCRSCADECLLFVEQFKKLDEPVQGKLTASSKATWIWKKSTALKLGQTVDRQINAIHLRLAISSMYILSHQWEIMDTWAYSA